MVRTNLKIGIFFDSHRLLLDPRATVISPLSPWDFIAARGYSPSAPGEDSIPSKDDNAGSMPKCVFVNEPFGWDEDQPPRHPWSETIIYELHVRGFTIHPTSGVDRPGTYRGLVEKIPYLPSLGVTAVELMPVQEFNENSVTRSDPKTGQPLKNYWGYDPVVFCAPKASYSSAGGLGQRRRESKEMVRRHRDHSCTGSVRSGVGGPNECSRGCRRKLGMALEEWRTDPGSRAEAAKPH